MTHGPHTSSYEQIYFPMESLHIIIAPPWSLGIWIIAVHSFDALRLCGSWKVDFNRNFQTLNACIVGFELTLHENVCVFICQIVLLCFYPKYFYVKLQNSYWNPPRFLGSWFGGTWIYITSGCLYIILTKWTGFCILVVIRKEACVYIAM